MATDPEGDYIDTNSQLLRVTLSGVLVVVAFWLLLIGQSLLIPLVLAVFIWYLIEALNGFWKRVRIAGKPIPRLVPAMLSTLVVFLTIYAFLSLIATNVTLMAEAAPEYQKKMTDLYEEAIVKFGIDERQLTDGLMQRVDLGKITAHIGSGIGSFMSNGILIAMYVVFLLIERPYFDAKLCAIVRTKGTQDTVRKTIGRIDEQVKIYLGVKIFVSLLTAGGAYVVMYLLGVDFALFWAVLIFVLNFIPYIGSTIASLLPTILALAQFGSLTQALIVFAGIQAVQMSVGYLVEPAMMGKSLNVSPLAVMLALSFWGLLWGITGMFISVPVTVIIMIICSNFESSRWVSILLSQDGTMRMEPPADETSTAKSKH